MINSSCTYFGIGNSVIYRQTLPSQRNMFIMVNSLQVLPGDSWLSSQNLFPDKPSISVTDKNLWLRKSFLLQSKPLCFFCLYKYLLDFCNSCLILINKNWKIIIKEKSSTQWQSTYHHRIPSRTSPQSLLQTKTSESENHFLCSQKPPSSTRWQSLIIIESLSRQAPNFRCKWTITSDSENNFCCSQKPLSSTRRK